MDDFKEYVTLDAEEQTDITALAEEDAADAEHTEEPAIDYENTVEPPVQKKGGVLQKTIIISMIIVAATVITAICFRLFAPGGGILKTDLLGNKKASVWHYQTQAYLEATADEATDIDYYLFFEPGDKLRIKIDTMEYTGTYQYQRITDEDKDNAGKPIIVIENTNLYLDNSHPFDGSYYFSEEGSGSSKKMKLTYVYDKSIVYEFDQKGYSAPKIEREGEFSGDDDLTGDWHYDNETTHQTLTFKKNGDYEVYTKSTDSLTKQTTITKEVGIYNCKDGKLTMMSGVLIPWETEYSYSINDEGLTMSRKARDPYTGQVVDKTSVYKK